MLVFEVVLFYYLLFGDRSALLVVADQVEVRPGLYGRRKSVAGLEALAEHVLQFGSRLRLGRLINERGSGQNGVNRRPPFERYAERRARLLLSMPILLQVWFDVRLVHVCMDHSLCITTLLSFSSLTTSYEIGFPIVTITSHKQVWSQKQFFEGAAFVAELRWPELAILQVIYQRLERDQIGILPDASVNLPCPVASPLNFMNVVQLFEEIRCLQAMKRVADDPVKLVICVQIVYGLGVVHEVLQFLSPSILRLTSTRLAHVAS